MSYNNISYEDDNSISNMFAKYFNTFYSDTHLSDITSLLILILVTVN
jgi:hypothetical protein